MKNVKNKLIFVLTSAILAAGLTVSASAQSFTYYGTSCPGSGTDWNTILSNEGSSNCDSGSYTIPYGSDSSKVLPSSDLKSLLGNLYSYCPSDQNSDSSKEYAETQTDTAGTSQTCPNTAKQDTADKQSAANVQAAADKSSCPTTVSKQPSSNTGATAKTSSPSEKAVTETKTAAKTAETKATAKTESAVQDSSASAAASAPTPSSCNTADIQTACNSNASQASGNTLMQCINSFLNKCGINLNSLGITLPGCGNTTASVPASNETDNTAQQPNTAVNTGTTAPSGGNANTGNQTKPSGSGQSAPVTTPSNQNGSASSSTQNADKQSFEEQVAALVNEQRAANGLQPLTLSTALSNAARVKSQDMHDKHYFAHESPTYGSPFDMLKSFGISYRAAGENIAMGYATPEAVMNAWMNSSGHRANILNASYTQIGVGYVADGNYWTQEFTG